MSTRPEPKTEDFSLAETALLLRRRVIEQSAAKKLPHLGSCLSCIDILTALYFNNLDINPSNPTDPDRDRFVLSKGHAAPALYQILALRGYFDLEMVLASDFESGSLFGEHPPAPKYLPGIEAATGSLGHGLPMAVGMALGGRIDRRSYRTIALLSDGECNEGSTWEAAMFAAGQRLGSLIAIIDFNKWQATGRSADVLAIDPLADKWCAFGWSVDEVDGHDIDALLEVLASLDTAADAPHAIVAHTVKGKGVSFMEDDNNWHYRIPNEAELAAAIAELEAQGRAT